MPPDRVLVLGPIVAEGHAVLARRPDLTVETLDDHDPARIAAALAAADGVLLRTQRLTAEMIAAAPRLRIVSRHGVGLDNLPIAALQARGIPVAVPGDANAQSVAEHALALLLAVAKRLPAFDAATRAGVWRQAPRPLELAGRTLLVVGFGRSGRLLARMAAGIGMTTRIATRTPADAAIRALGAEPVALEAGLAASDAIALHLPALPDGRPLLDAARLALLRPGAILVNVSRGSLIDQDALAAALDAGRLFGAALDVLEPEPPPPDHRLLGRPDVLVTPHVAGVTDAAMIRMATISAENLLAGLDGRLDPTMRAV